MWGCVRGTREGAKRERVRGLALPWPRNLASHHFFAFSFAHTAGEVTDSNPLVLGGLFAGWYAFNIYFNM